MSVALVRLQIRSDLSTNWKNINPLLSKGEPGAESDTGRMKVGDGTSRWNQLPYVGGDGSGGTFGSVDGGIYDGLPNTAGATAPAGLSVVQEGATFFLSWLPAVPYDNDVYVTAYFIEAFVVSTSTTVGLGATNSPGEPVPLEAHVGGMILTNGEQYRFSVKALLSDGSIGESAETAIVQYVEPTDPALQVVLSSDPAGFEVGSEGETITLTAAASGGNGTYQYGWLVDGQEVASAAASITLTGSDYGVGSYAVQLTVLSGQQQEVVQDTLLVVDTSPPPPPAQTLPLYNWGPRLAGSVTPGAGKNIWWMPSWEDSYEKGYPPSSVVPGVYYPFNSVYGADAPGAAVYSRMGDWVLGPYMGGSPGTWYQRYENNGNVVYVDSGQTEAYGGMVVGTTGGDPNRLYCYARHFHARREYVDFGSGPIEFGVILSEGLYTRTGGTAVYNGPFIYSYKPTTGSLGPLTRVPLLSNQYPQSVHFTYDYARDVPPDYNGSTVYTAVSVVFRDGAIRYTTDGMTWNDSNDFRDAVPSPVYPPVWFTKDIPPWISATNASSPNKFQAQRT